MSNQLLDVVKDVLAHVTETMHTDAAVTVQFAAGDWARLKAAAEDAEDPQPAPAAPQTADTDDTPPPPAPAGEPELI